MPIMQGKHLHFYWKWEGFPPREEHDPSACPAQALGAWRWFSRVWVRAFPLHTTEGKRCACSVCSPAPQAARCVCRAGAPARLVVPATLAQGTRGCAPSCNRCSGIVQHEALICFVYSISRHPVGIYSLPQSPDYCFNY